MLPLTIVSVCPLEDCLRVLDSVPATDMKPSTSEDFDRLVREHLEADHGRCCDCGAPSVRQCICDAIASGECF